MLSHDSVWQPELEQQTSNWPMTNTNVMGKRGIINSRLVRVHSDSLISTVVLLSHYEFPSTSFLYLVMFSIEVKEKRLEI